MNLMKKSILCLFFVFILSPLFAETIILKSGKSIDGKILEKTDEYIKIDFYGTPITYSLDEVERIVEQGVLESGKESKIETTSTTTKDIDKGKENILESIKKAAQNIQRIKTKTTQDIDIKQLLHTKTEEISDVDFQQKVMHISSKILEYDFSFKDLSSSYLDKEMLKAKEKGVSSEKIQQMQELADKFGGQMQKTMDEMVKVMKGKKSEIFIIDKNMYVNLKDKWIKMEFPFFELFWQVIAEYRTGNISKEEIKTKLKSMLNNYSQSTKIPLEPLIASLDKVGYGGEIYDTAAISEDSFLGKPCYVLDIKNKEIADAMKEGLLAQAKASGDAEVKASVDSFVYKEFISKDDYLKLGFQLNSDMSVSSPTRSPQLLKASLKIDAVYTYPQDKIEVPSELEQATAVKDEEELKKVMMEDMVGELPFDFLKNETINTQNK